MADQHDPIDDWLGRRLSLLKVGARRSLLIYAAGAIIGLGLAGFALFTAKGSEVRAFPAEDIALVNGRHVLRSDFVTQTEITAGVPFAQTTRAQREKVLNDMINEELMVQRGLEVDLAASDPDVRAAMVGGVNLQVDADVVAQRPTEPELRQYFETHLEKYSSDGVMRMRDLVLPADAAKPAEAEAKAKQAVEALRHGTPVDAVKAKYGMKDSDQIDQEDNFDFAVKAKLGEDIYKAAAALTSGQVSDPLQRPDGVHVIVMVKRVSSAKLDFAKAEDNVWQDFKNAERARVDEANLKYLRSRADITVAPEFRAAKGAQAEAGQ